MHSNKPRQADLDIGAGLRRLRLAQNLTLTEVATLSETDAGNLSRVERNEQHITFGRLARICDALGLRVVELLRHVERWQEMEAAGSGRDELTLRARKMLQMFSDVAVRDQMLLLGLANSMLLANLDAWPAMMRPRIGRGRDKGKRKARSKPGQDGGGEAGGG
ncbi:hypothetical protein CEK62_04595 [Alcanivorax sp. N3-2A]|nr:hypothetical protein CEK62_04595 [Alcanivorax sp. N3-2A]|tara:strand:+ start:1040 stop:1528 length:489 start_codon:yes stop_codon:yes gene_type:complete